MGEAPRATALIPPPSLALPCVARLCAAFTAAVALPPIASAAYQHVALAARAGKRSATRRPAANRSSSTHRLARSSLGHAAWQPTGSQHRWTCSPAGAILCAHSWLTRWGAVVETTCPSLRLPRPFYNTAPVLPRLRPGAQSFASVVRQRPLAGRPPSHHGVWGEPPGQAYVLQDKSAAAISSGLHASRVLMGSHSTHAARAL